MHFCMDLHGQARNNIEQTGQQELRTALYYYYCGYRLLADIGRLHCYLEHCKETVQNMTLQIQEHHPVLTCFFWREAAFIQITLFRIWGESSGQSPR